MDDVGQLLVHDEAHRLLLLAVRGVARVAAQRGRGVPPAAGLGAAAAARVGQLGLGVRVGEVVVRLGDVRLLGGVGGRGRGLGRRVLLAAEEPASW